MQCAHCAITVQRNAAGSLRVSLRYSLSVVPQDWGPRGLKEIAIQTPSPFHSPPVRARRAVPQPLPAGAYFVTICTRERGCLLGQVVDGEMRLNPLGEMAAAGRHAVPHHFPRVVLDEAIIMPNHIHGIIVTVGAKHPLSPFMCLRNDRNRMLRPDDRVRPDGSRQPDSGDHKDRPCGTMAAASDLRIVLSHIAARAIRSLISPCVYPRHDPETGCEAELT
jgi:REP element-mobilizing transposase RayT